MLNWKCIGTTLACCNIDGNSMNIILFPRQNHWIEDILYLYWIYRTEFRKKKDADKKFILIKFSANKIFRFDWIFSIVSKFHFPNFVLFWGRYCSNWTAISFYLCFKWLSLECFHNHICEMNRIYKTGFATKAF